MRPKEIWAEADGIPRTAATRARSDFNAGFIVHPLQDGSEPGRLGPSAGAARRSTAGSWELYDRIAVQIPKGRLMGKRLLPWLVGESILAKVTNSRPRRSGGMADAPDSKSGPRKWVWVQV